MNLRQNESKRMVLAPAKLNLYLDVFDRREDGYHELETLMVPVRLCDSLTLEPLPLQDRQTPRKIQLSVRPRWDRSAPLDRSRSVPTGSDNLVVRALELLRQRSGCADGARLELIKRIPAAAGLGGGSSDAAAALKLANLAWRLCWDRQRLCRVAEELGSDVPFFLYGGAAICRGRGQLVEKFSSNAPIHFVVVMPAVGLRTVDVYQRLDEQTANQPLRQRFARGLESANSLSHALRRGALAEIGLRMCNRLQAAAESLLPWIELVRRACAQLDFVGHQLSGSGSAYFGVCRHRRHAHRLATILRTRRLGLVLVTRSFS